MGRRKNECSLAKVLDPRFSISLLVSSRLAWRPDFPQCLPGQCPQPVEITSRVRIEDCIVARSCPELFGRYTFLGTSMQLYNLAGELGILTNSPQVANWGLPIAALSDLRKDEEMISGTMTPTLAVYSCVTSH